MTNSPPAASHRSASRRRVRGGAGRQLVDSLVCLAVAVILFRTFQVEGYMISTGSMAPHLLGWHKQVVCPACRCRFAYGVAHDESASGNSGLNAVGQTAHDVGDAASIQADAGSVGREGDNFEDPNHDRTLVAVSRREQSKDNIGGGAPAQQLVVCPNCGQTSINVSSVPRNQGDQLLVQRNAYEWRDPVRWDVVVFRNPGDPTQAYVKRIAGLPGESIRIVRGDVYIDDVLQRKSLETQRALRVPVFDHDLDPVDDPEWRSRWRAAHSDAAAGWSRLAGGFTHSAAGENDGEKARTPSAAERTETDNDPEWSWLHYHHWIRSGGRHTTSVGLGKEPATFRLPRERPAVVNYDERTRRLSVRGVMTEAARNLLIRANEHPAARAAIARLAAESHFAPITDQYGYNQAAGGRTPAVVRDVMLSAEFQIGDGARIDVVLRDGRREYHCFIDVEAGEAWLSADPPSVDSRHEHAAPDATTGAASVVRRADLTAHAIGGEILVEASLFDRQVLLAVNGRPVFAPFPIPASIDAKPEPSLKAPRNPVSIGAAGGQVEVRRLMVWRDVYYTDKGGDEPFTLADGEYYMLGDNSPVSSDSRSWPASAVHKRLFLGRPFVVHLPSKPGRFRVGPWSGNIRIPDLSRVRYIR